MEPKASFTTEQVQEALQIRDFQFLRKAFLENEVADIAEVFSHLPLPEAIVSFRLVARARRVEVFSKLELEKQEELLEELPEYHTPPPQPQARATAQPAGLRGTPGQCAVPRAQVRLERRRSGAQDRRERAGPLQSWRQGNAAPPGVGR